MLTAGGRLLYSGLFTRTGLDFTFFLILCHCFSGLPVQVWRPNDTQPGWSICSSLLQRFQGFSCFCCDGKAALAQPLQFTCLLPHSYEQVLQRAWKDAGFVISFIATCPWSLLARKEDHLLSANRWLPKGLCCPRFLVSSFSFCASWSWALYNLTILYCRKSNDWLFLV